jgi:hypothetical protein
MSVAVNKIFSQKLKNFISFIDNDCHIGESVPGYIRAALPLATPRLLAANVDIELLTYIREVTESVQADTPFEECRSLAATIRSHPKIEAYKTESDTLLTLEDHQIRTLLRYIHLFSDMAWYSRPSKAQ